MDVITLAMAKAHVKKQEFWTDKHYSIGFHDYINLTTAMTTPGGSIRIDAEAGSELENLLKEVIAALSKGPATIVIRPETDSLMPVRIISWTTQHHFAFVTTVAEYFGLLLLVTFEFHLDRLVYTVRTISAEPMVPAT